MKISDSGFPLEKAIQYEKLRKPFVINDLEKQWDIQGLVRSRFRSFASSTIVNQDTIINIDHDQVLAIGSFRTLQRQSKSLSDSERQ